MSQIALPLDWPAAESASDFIVTPANQAAVRHLEHLSLWPVMATILTGPRKSGRSFLGRLFASRSDAMLIDDADRVDEERIFHAWNSANENRRPLLLIADQPPPVWDITLPDLASRLAATPHVAISEPDDRLMEGLLERLMGARGLPITPDVARWIARRIERSYVSVNLVVDMLDQAAWRRRGGISIPLVREVLSRNGVIHDS